VERSYPRLTSALINWHARRGRHDLPWQKERSPYRVWISEVMLQQTQVITVVPYYERFIARFPDVQSLAAAGIDEVLHLWTGLGYYARARNLHRAAQRLCADFGGQLPSGFDALVSLPGIGRSTAGAILALSYGAPFPILDGNAKRVFARFFGVTGSPNDTVLTKRLWQLAERCTPREKVAVYTQSIMDLGATVCVRRKPLCDLCPLGKWCIARASGRQYEIPAPRVSAARRRRKVFMLVALRDDHSVLLERRPATGIWGGLWCLPEFNSLSSAKVFADQSLQHPRVEAQALEMLQHSFTHFDLVIAPVLTRCSGAAGIMDETQSLWYNSRDPARVGMPAPIKTLLDRLADPTLFDAHPTGRLES